MENLLKNAVKELAASGIKTSSEEVYTKLVSTLYQGSWKSYGAGETGCPVYSWLFDDEGPETLEVAHLSGDNGCNTFYNPEGEPWSESIEDVEEDAIKCVLENVEPAEIRILY